MEQRRRGKKKRRRRGGRRGILRNSGKRRAGLVGGVRIWVYGGGS